MQMIIIILSDSSTILKKLDINISLFREGVKKKQQKSCNIVTTPVHLPTYPYWCTEGNFFNFF